MLKAEWQKIQEVREAQHKSFKYEINSFEDYATKNYECKWGYVQINSNSGCLVFRALGVSFSEKVNNEDIS